MIIRWNYESPLYIDQTIASLTDRLNKDKTDFNDVPIENGKQSLKFGWKIIMVM